MKFGVREICDVVLKAKAAQKIGNKIFYKNEPVIYFDSLKTSSMEGAATTVYAQGGRGNSRLVAWEGERTVTFTMEDALISPEGFMILSGAGMIEADATKETFVYQHMMETTDEVYVVAGGKVAGVDFADAADGDIVVFVENKPYLPTDGRDNYAYIMLTTDGMPDSEPLIPVHQEDVSSMKINGKDLYPLVIKSDDDYWVENATWTEGESAEQHKYVVDASFADKFRGAIVLVDYYVKRGSNARQIEITPDKFGGNYYLEASTLFRDTNGVDMPAEFIIPNCKIQSNFTFTMASSGDPSTFTFTMDAFPDYTRFDKTKKVLAAIQIIDGAGSMNLHRHATNHVVDDEKYFI